VVRCACPKTNISNQISKKGNYIFITFSLSKLFLMIRSGIFYTIVAFLLIVCSSTQLSAQELTKKYKGYVQAYYKGMRYGLFKPENYDNKISYPLIVYLHGSTDTVSRDNVWYQESVQKTNPCFVITPKTTEANQGWGNTWESNHPEAMRKTLSLVDSITSKYNIDKNRLYIYGISMGGFGTFSTLAKEPKKFAAAYAVCGGSNTDAASSITTPLWIFHGADDDVVPVRLSKNMYDAMVAKGNHQVRYTEYPGVKHNSWENVNREKTLSKWLLAQVKGQITTAPEQITGLTLKKHFNSTVQLQWNKPANTKARDKAVWYYKVFRDDDLIAEVDAEMSEFNDYKYKNNAGHIYKVVAVNYFFQESQPSATVRLE
jgi:poly(3-hydroxybutyrate) depolymerase